MPPAVFSSVTHPERIGKDGAEAGSTVGNGPPLATPMERRGRMSGCWSTIALVIVLVLVNAAFSGSEMARISLREGQLKQLEREGTAKALRLVRLGP